jgi:hypothetical protein
MKALLFARRTFFNITGVVFLVVGVLHAARAFYDWPFVLNIWFIPVWFSWVVALFAFVLAYNAFTYLK